MTDVIYYFPIDGEGKEKDALPIRLSADGSADVSALPEGVREHLSIGGIFAAGGLKPILPKDGEVFLQALLTLGNPYMRFRSSPDKAV